MKFDVVTIFPEFFAGPLHYGIVRRARESGLIDIRVHDLRQFTHDRHKTVDDRPFGGGEGMVLKPEPIFRAVETILSEPVPQQLEPDDARNRPNSTAVVLLSASGKIFVQEMAHRFAGLDRMVLLCGRYEGADERRQRQTAVNQLVEEISRVPAILDYPHYTRPADFRGWRVPDVLLSGDHEEIRRWRERLALEKTLRNRPDLLSRTNQ